MSSEIILIKGVKKVFQTQSVLNDINIAFEQGKIYGVIGRNGSGKTVLLKCIAGLIVPTAGKIWILGKELHKQVDFAPSTGMLFEQTGLLLQKSALKNMCILSSLKHKPRMDKIHELLNLVGLDVENNKPVCTYSMGMKQRLGLAMSLLDNPSILLLDEPFSYLDERGANKMRQTLRNLAKEGVTIILATHVKEDIDGLCDTIIRIENGELQL